MFLFRFEGECIYMYFVLAVNKALCSFSVLIVDNMVVLYETVGHNVNC